MADHEGLIEETWMVHPRGVSVDSGIVKPVTVYIHPDLLGPPNLAAMGDKNMGFTDEQIAAQDAQFPPQG
jgi:hypothetical protein